MAKSNGPVLIDLEGQVAEVTPATAPPVPEILPSGQAMQTVVSLGARRPSLLARLFWWLVGAIFSFALSVWAWDFVQSLLGRNEILGYIALGLTSLFILVVLAIAVREWFGFRRLKRLDRLHNEATRAFAENDLEAARTVIAGLERLYSGRHDLSWARERLRERKGEVLDADGLLGLAETELLVPLDKAARKEIEAAARQVATVTAIVPLALADLVTALASNMRMIRRIAEIYGGRAGTLGNWRLTRTILAHLVATGAVAIGDDLIGSVAGGGVLSKISRRFGEGIINGALTARVGVAAMEVCRPLPFQREKRPSVTGLVQRALTGLFGREKVKK